jgi:2-oxoglutarate/2-oxoacid ferredoxin oxidoreductase subunit alpha
MSDTVTGAPSAGGAKKISRVSEAIIRIAGNSQDGIQAIGGFLARLAGRSEQEVMTFMTIPSTISGGPSIFQVRIGSGEVLSSGDDADVLLAFYQHSYEEHINSVKKKGIVLYDSDHVQPKPEWEGGLSPRGRSQFRRSPSRPLAARPRTRVKTFTPSA